LNANSRKPLKSWKSQGSNSQNRAHREEGTYAQNAESTQLREKNCSPTQIWTKLDLDLFNTHFNLSFRMPSITVERRRTAETEPSRHPNATKRLRIRARDSRFCGPLFSTVGEVRKSVIYIKPQAKKDKKLTVHLHLQRLLSCLFLKTLKTKILLQNVRNI